VFLSLAIHLAKVVFIDDRNIHGGVEGEELLDPVLLEVEWTPGGRQEAGELSGGLRSVETTELVDETCLDNVGAHLVGNLMAARACAPRSTRCGYYSSRKLPILVSEEKSFVHVSRLHDSSVSEGLDDFIGIFIPCLSGEVVPDGGVGEGLSFVGATQVLSLTFCVTEVLICLKGDASAGNQAGDVVRT
jgi:hypothetical protein